MLERSYVPYSHFPGAQPWSAPTGRVFTGCNVENRPTAPPFRLGAPALVKAVSEGHRDDSPASPW